MHKFEKNKTQVSNDKCWIRERFHKANKFLYCSPESCLNSPEYQSHAAELLYFLKTLWQSKTLCDLCFIINEKKYEAHRLAMAMFSTKYRELFQTLKTSSNKDKETYTIHLKKTSCRALESILAYIYTAQIDINPINVEELLSAAKELGIDDLISMTRDYLKSLSFGQVLDYMRRMIRNENGTNKNDSQLIFYELYVYVMTHLDKIVRTPEFLNASRFVIRTLLSDSHLRVNSELDVLDAALKWIEYDADNRVNHLKSVMSCVRFTLMRPDELAAHVECQAVLVDDSDVFRMIHNAYRYHALVNTNTTTIDSNKNNDNNKKKENGIDNRMKKMNLKSEEIRNVCLRGASVPDCFVKAINELSKIAHRLKETRILREED